MLIGVFETLRSAGRELVLELGEPAPLGERAAELHEAARCLVDDASATDAQRRSAQGMLDVLVGGHQADRLFDLSGFRASGERAATYEEARKRVEQAALDLLAQADRELLQELLDRFGAQYAAAKERESALDFEDLQLVARNLLRDNEQIREREQLRFKAVMVDEFQDTNRLQCELVDLVSQGPGEHELFFVGDEFQSIYGFRHADVRVFRDRRADPANTLLALTRNYRSRPQVLAAVNRLFGEEFGDEFQPLAASGEFDDPVFGHPVELLVTDKESYSETGVHWRRGEAKAIARRVRELVDAGAAEPGEIVLLFAAGTDAEWYEQELRRLDLPTYRATGKGYYGQQQVNDLLQYLRLIQNRYDDEAVLTVLASPFVGVSNDALVLIRRAASKRPLFTGIERGVPSTLPERDAQLVRAFRQRYDRLVTASTRLSLERLCERVIADHDYDLAVLAQWDGNRRYANLRKLARLARSYEELRGPDIEGFVRFVRQQDALGSTEREAVSEEEGADAVRLLTIHSAKGLEFKVVVVADAGRDRAPPADEILALADGRFGFQMRDPATSKPLSAFSYDEVKAAREAEERAERLRLYYVAMTRAIDRLIVSGAVDDRRDTPIGWVVARLELDEELTSAEPIEVERGPARVLVRVDRFAPDAEPDPRLEPAAEAATEIVQLSLFGDLPDGTGAPAIALPALEPIPAPPLHRARRLSFTALSEFESCSYKYYARRVVGMRERRPVATASGHEGMGGMEIGDAVHRLLEQIEPAQPVAPDVEQVRAWYPSITDEELERVTGYVANWCESDLAQRLASLDDVQVERPFLFEHDGVVLEGRLDVLHRDGDQALVLDYKTNPLGDALPEQIIDEHYSLQRLVYALACFRAGAEEVEVVYAFVERPDAIVTTTFSRDDVPELEAGLSEAIRRIHAEEFVPTPSDWACSTCPALDVVCAGPRLPNRPRPLAAVG